MIVNSYSKIPKLYGMEKFFTEQVMDNLDMFQYRSGKIDEFGWWDLERISACGVHLTLLAPEHQEMNVQVEVT